MTSAASKPTVLILCTGNSCRSHMAEGILRAAAGDILDVRSAGSNPAGYVHPLAIRAMAEIGIDLSGHTSKHMNDFLAGDVETVVTVCGNADQACPMFPGQRNRHHWGFDDPAHAEGDDEAKMRVFRRVRDEIQRVFGAYADGRRDAMAAENSGHGKRARVVEVYDPPMCCSTGVCGPQVDPALAAFAADLKWVEKQGVEVRRHNLSQNPMAFVENAVVQATLAESGESALPILLADGKAAAVGRYPERRELASLLGLPAPAARVRVDLPAFPTAGKLSSGGSRPDVS